MITADRFRRLALDMSGATESSHMGHPDFRANGRIFATLHQGERSGVVKLSPDEQTEVIRQTPQAFSPSAGAWGRQGWTHVQFATADEASVRAALLLAWERVTRSPARRTRVGTGAAGRAVTRPELEHRRAARRSPPSGTDTADR
jgi:hypothetical protein